MAVGFSNTNKPLNPRGQDASPKGYNRAALYSGKALDFDGVNDKVSGSASNLPTGANAFTTCFYFKQDTNHNGEIFAWGSRSTNQSNGYKVQSSNNFLHYFYGNDLAATLQLKNNAYYFVAVTFDGTTRSIYINGQLDISDTPTGVNVTGTNYYLGQHHSGTQFFNGQAANTKVFNTALTAAQVADLYNNPEKVVPTGVDNTALKLWLPMMEGAGTTAYDGSGNGNHGTISGATYVNGIGAPSPQSAVMDWNKGSNLVTYSEQFDNSAWQKTSVIVTADATTAPDGTQTADEIEFTATDSLIMDQFVNVANSNHIASIFVKNKDIGVLKFDMEGGAPSILARVDIDLVNGTLSNSVGDFTPTIEDYGNGWYRVAIGDGGDGNIATPAYKLRYLSATGSFYAWGAQVEAANSLGAYIPNHTGTPITSEVLLPQGLTTGRDITGVNLFENVRKQGALNLDGNSWAEVHDNASVDLTTSLSLEVWCYPTEDGHTSGRELIGKFISSSLPYQCWVIEYKPNQFNFAIGATDNTFSGITSTNGKTKNNWYHVVATYDGANRKIYVNGVQEGTAAFTKTPQTTDENIAIGRWLGQAVGGTNTFFGPIAQPRIYNRALTASEVLRNYNSGKNTYTND